MAEFRGNHCPSRGTGLSHAFGPSDPQGICAHCKVQLSDIPPMGVPPNAVEVESADGRAVYATIFDHMYQFTITGRCARHGCSQFKDYHAGFLIGTAPGECIVDHKTVKPWTECGNCREVVEPSLPEDRTVGKRKGGRGRLPFTRRHMAELDKMHDAWIGGYYKS